VPPPCLRWKAGVMSPERFVTSVSGTDLKRMVGERGFEPPTSWSRVEILTIYGEQLMSEISLGMLIGDSPQRGPGFMSTFDTDLSCPCPDKGGGQNDTFLSDDFVTYPLSKG
jgi:hypothetical protein